MSHVLTSAFQQTLWIGNLGTTKESNVDVSFKRIDIAECRVSDTRSRVPIMQYLSNVVSAGAHEIKPLLGDYSQFTRMVAHPDLDGWVSLDRSGKSEKLVHVSSRSSSFQKRKGYSRFSRRCSHRLTQ